MTTYTALLITTAAWLIYAAVCIYAMRCQAKWIAALQSNDEEDHHG